MEIIYKIEDFPDPGDRDLFIGIQEINKTNYIQSLTHFQKASRYENEYAEMFFAITALVFPFCMAPECIQLTVIINLFEKISVKWNNPAAQYCIGCIYLENELGEDRDETLAVYWLSLAANNGWSDAMARLAVAYFHGTLVERNYAKALFWFEKIVAKYEAKTNYFMDNQLFLFEKENFELKLLAQSHGASMGLFLDDNTYTALPMLFCRTLVPPEELEYELKEAYIWSSFTNKKSASLAISHYYLARLYNSEEINDLEVCSRHMYWLEKAAKNNEKNAILLMGAAYENGITVKRDYKEAMKWYEKVYNFVGTKGIGAVGIGRLYHTGKGVKKNCNTALTYYQEAIGSHTFHPPYYLIGEIYRNGGDGVLQVQEVSFYYYYMSFKRLRDPKGLRGIADMDGSIYINNRYKMSLRCPQTQYRLGKFYFNGFLRSKVELEKALLLFKRSDAGDYEAAKHMVALVEKQLLFLPIR